MSDKDARMSSRSPPITLLGERPDWVSIKTADVVVSRLNAPSSKLSIVTACAESAARTLTLAIRVDANGAWNTEEAIRNWQQNAEHLEAQHAGRTAWYDEFDIRVCRVIRQQNWKYSD